MFPKPKTFRNRKYLEFIRKQPCILTGRDFTETDVVAHHIRLGAGAGVGQKPSDYRTIPLTAEKHVELHNTGEKMWFLCHNIDYETEMKRLMIKFIGSEMAGSDDLCALEEYIEYRL